MAHNEIATSPQREEQQSSPDSQVKLARRQLLTTGSRRDCRRSSARQCARQKQDPPVKAGHTNTFPQPVTIFPDPGGDTDFGDVHLNLNTFTFCDGTSGQVRSYNGYTPGPTLVVNPGGKLTLTLYNDLPANPAAGATNDHCGQPDAMNNPNCFNTTNIHFHGLHSSPCSIWEDGLPDCGPGHTGQPKVAGDDVLFEIPPIVQGGKPQKYCVWLPRFHAPGTHWYHAHKHGSAAIQVANGLAGALIVRERRPLVRRGNDFVWLIQEALPTTEDWKIYPPPAGPGNPPTFFFINGECQPTLRTNAGKTLRLRFINATGTPRGFTRLQIVKCSSDPNAVCDDAVPPDTEPTKTIYLMAVDGITFYGHKPQPKPWWDTAPGNRADFLVQFAQAEVGVYKVVKSLVQNSPLSAPRQVLGYIAGATRISFYKGSGTAGHPPASLARRSRLPAADPGERDQRHPDRRVPEPHGPKLSDQREQRAREEIRSRGFRPQSFARLRRGVDAVEFGDGRTDVVPAPVPCSHQPVSTGRRTTGDQADGHLGTRRAREPDLVGHHPHSTAIPPERAARPAASSCGPDSSTIPEHSCCTAIFWCTKTWA